MSWHYTSAGQQKGPVEESALQELFRAGTVQPETLVWRPGMDGWKPYNVVFLGAQSSVRYGGFWIRVVASIIDAIIVGVAGSIVQAPFAPMFLGSGFPFNTDFPETVPEVPLMIGAFGMVWGLGLAVDAAYHTLFVALRGATPGKMVFGMKVVRADGQAVSLGLAAGRWLASWVSCLTLFIGYIIAAFDAQKRTLHDHICDTRVVRTR